MATGGRRYWVELFDVQTFHPRRTGVDVVAAPAVSAELDALDLDGAELLRRELVAVLVELRARHGVGVGIRLQRVREFKADLPPSSMLVMEALERLPNEKVLMVEGDPVVVSAAVLNAAGELVGTTCQAAR